MIKLMSHKMNQMIVFDKINKKIIVLSLINNFFLKKILKLMEFTIE